jgi:hypothetical protein
MPAQTSAGWSSAGWMQDFIFIVKFGNYQIIIYISEEKVEEANETN